MRRRSRPCRGTSPGRDRPARRAPRGHRQPRRRAPRQLAEDVAAGVVPSPDFVVWPENSTAVDPFLDAEVNAGIVSASDAIGVPILLGVMADDPLDDTQVLNQGIVYHPGVGGGDRYTKRHPVPYGEYIPFRGSFIPSDYGQLRMIPRDMVRGTSLEPLRVADVLVADAICFDVAYDEGIGGQVARGAQLVVVQTSNAMFSETAQLDQQFEISRLRALETGRWVVVAAVNGISGVVRPDGSVVASAGRPDVRRARRDRRPADRGSPPRCVSGSWPARSGPDLPGGPCAGRPRHLSSAPTRRPSVHPVARTTIEVAPRECRRPRPVRDGRPDLQRVREHRVDRGTPPRGPAGRRRHDRGRQQPRRHRRHRRPAGGGRRGRHGGAPHREGRSGCGLPQRLRRRARRRLRRDRRDGRGRVPPARAAPPPAGRPCRMPTW